MTTAFMLCRYMAITIQMGFVIAGDGEDKYAPSADEVGVHSDAHDARP